LKSGNPVSIPNTVRRLLTTKRVLALGFGFLLTLLGLSGVNAILVLSQLRSHNESILEDFVERVQHLDEIRSTIYLSGTYIRDYLLEPDPEQAEPNRVALRDARERIDSLLIEHGPQAGETDQALYEALKREIQDYWRVLEPVLTWDARQRRTDGYRFLHDQVLPRRSNTLKIADTIASANRQQLLRRDHRLVDMFSGLRNQLIVSLAVMLLLGFAQAAAGATHILRLEKQTLSHLAEAREARQELKSLSASLVSTQENERKNISRDLHDAVGQSLSAVQFELHSLTNVPALDLSELRSRVSRIRELVESSAAMVRNVSLLLRPSMLDDLGLVAALEWQSLQIARSTGIRITVTTDGLPEQIPEEHKTCIFRVAQEALNNVCRHANANTVKIHLTASAAGMVVVVQDDGKGFRLTRNKGFGLVGMEERAQSLGGSLIIDSDLGRGTTIGVSLPLPPRLDARNYPGSEAPGRAPSEWRSSML
jgi:signal transduction histidine kinase